MDILNGIIIIKFLSNQFFNTDLYEARSVLAHADRLMRMPIVLTMGEKDTLIPVVETRKVAAALRENPRFVYREIPAGDHDSAL